jgi:hypothetical protein
MPRGIPASGAIKKSTCRYCKELISNLNISKHEVACAKRTPEQRAKLTSARATYYRHKDSNLEKYRASTSLVASAKRPYNKTGQYRQAIRLNGKKGRLTVQLSVPMKVALTIVRELVPHIEIDRVGVE